MQRSFVVRMSRLLMLLLYGSALGLASVLDGVVAAEASRQTAHLESDATAACAAHDEASCQLCRITNAGTSAPTRAVPWGNGHAGAPPAPSSALMPLASPEGMRHSRAPPAA